MKHYLDLVPISAKVHRKQNRMSIFCIILAVFLITAIFGMADMFIRSQIIQAKIDNGDFHITVQGITDEEARLIKKRPDVKAAARYGVLNFNDDKGYTISDKKSIIVGADEEFVTQLQMGVINEGNFPQNDNEAMITKNAGENLGLQIGDTVTIKRPGEPELSYQISGFCNNTSKIMSEDAYGVFLTTSAFREIGDISDSTVLADHNMVLFVQFTKTYNIQNTINRLKEDCNLSAEQISENTKLLGLLGQSSNSFMMQVYISAFVLFVLVLTAGIMMITSSLNSNVAQRTEFFGLMRCVGATPKQIMKFVRKEALNWCKVAIPIGIITGVLIIWILCALLRVLSPEFFSAMPIFGISIPSIAAGIAIGILTVLLASCSPAKKAAKVSPLAAVSGNAINLQPVRTAANTKFFKVDTALGIHHAKSSRKNFFLTITSFSLSVILFLSFSVAVTFMNHVSMNYIITTEQLTKKYKSFVAVNDVTLHIRKGSIYGFLGPNGAGKSTTMKMLLGLTAPTNGSFTIDGKHFPTDRIAILKEVGSFIESPSFYANLTGKENLDIIRRILGLPQSTVDDALELVGLSEFGNRLAKKYSLGMKQRLGLAGALLGRPPILILDEPTNGLDPSGIHEIRNLIKSLPDLYDCTVLISSHMLSEIELIADDIGILNHGRLLFEGSLDDLRQHALQSGFATDNLEDMFLSMVEKDNASRKQRAKL